MIYELPKLDYAYDALEPYIDAQTMELHHSKHHAGYVKKLNAALEGHAEVSYDRLEDLLLNIQNLPEDIRVAVKNNGNQVYNHNMFWKSLAPKGQGSGEPGEKLGKLIANSFGDFESFKQEFTDKALGLFGSGWIWLYLKDERLKIGQFSNEGNPLSGGTPLLPLDVWEHGYYLKYQNKRPEYVESWWNVVNWDFVESLLG